MAQAVAEGLEVSPSGPDSPWVSRDGTLYYLSADRKQMKSMSAVSRQPKVLAESMNSIFEFVVGGGQLYWREWSESTQSSEIRTVTLAGGTPQSFVRDIYGGVSRLGIVEQHLYWAQETRGVHHIASRALSGTGAVERVTADLATNVVPDVVYDPSGVYWSSQDDPTAIRMVPPSGGNQRVVFRGEAGKQVRPLSVSDGYVYFTYFQTDAGVPIHKVRVTGEGPSALLATAPYVGFTTIVAERDRLFFFAKAESFYISQTTGQFVRITQTKDFAQAAEAFAIDDTTATWLDRSGRLWKTVR